MDPQTTLSEDNLFLLQELPDPQQELAIQTLLDEFHYFPKLPKELRLMIWRATFRPREILLPDYKYHPDGSLDFKPIFPPITSRINQESRDETNLHYLLFWIPWDNTLGDPRQERLCFAPKRDTFVLGSHVLEEIYQFDDFPAPRLEAYEAIFPRVKKLEIVESFWYEYVRDSRLWDYSLLRRFEDLDKLIVERPHKPGPDGFGLASDQEFAICLKSLTNFFDHEKGKDPNFKIPQVIRRDWDKDLVFCNVHHDMDEVVKWCKWCQGK